MDGVTGHRIEGTAKHYDLYDMADEKRRALNAWAAHIDALLTDKPANVVPLRERA